MTLKSTDYSARFARLSPEKRALLMRRLQQKPANGTPVGSIPRRDRQEDLPLSFSQERLWFLEQMEPGSPAYNMPLALCLTGPLKPVLGRVFDEIQRRHEILRTTFTRVNAKPVQRVFDEPLGALEFADLGNIAEKDRRGEAERLASMEAHTPFDLCNGPLFRARLLRLREDEHVLLLTMHHIISDGWSMDVFIRELAELYRAFASDTSPALAELPIQYADFALWQRSWLQGDILGKQLSFWKQHLAKAPPVIELPTDRPRPAVQTFRGAYHTLALDSTLTSALRQRSREWGGTLFMILLATFKTLLHRYTGDETVVVGTPSANRNRAEIEDLIGVFVNTLVLCTDFAGDPSFYELFGRVRMTALGANEHQDLPFEKLVEELHPERNLSHTPLFQVMFILQTPAESLELEGLAINHMDVHSGTAKFDITLGLVDSPDGVFGAFEYNTDLFDAATIERMAAHYQRLLRAVLERPELPVSALPMLSDAEKRELLLRWNDTDAKYEAGVCFHQLFEAQAQRTPEAGAVRFGGQELSYAELNARSNRLAARLGKMGVAAETLVGVSLERSPEMLVSLLAVMKAGGAYVPLDPTYPTQRLRYMLEDARVRVLLSEGSVLERLPPTSADVLCVDDDAEQFRQEPAADQDCWVCPDSLAYVIYTSGSTGKPKGVAIRHGSLVNFLQSMARCPGISSEDVLAAVTTPSFDIAGLELYLPLLAGATVFMVDADTAADGRALAVELEQQKASMMQATPATWRMLLDSGWQGKTDLRMLCGGEALPRDLADELIDSGAGLWNLYGPTETTVWSSVQQVGTGTVDPSVGRPISNTKMYVLDKALQPVPAGVYGELYIGGAGLARGYLNAPDLTAQRFLSDPFSGEKGARMYRTGDRARFLGDGSLELSGRLDHQVKVRGFRIELGEVETWLNSYDGVRQAVAVVRQEPGEANRLVAYLLTDEGQRPGTQALRTFLGEALPAYMIPGSFVFLTEFPLTPNGKIDRKALPAPDSARPELETGYLAPHNEVERTIASIWRDVLCLEKIGIDDNFFDLGGHSLLLVQVQSRLSEEFSRDVAILDLFKYSSVKSLATFLTQGRNETTNFKKLEALASRQKKALARQEMLMKGVKGAGDE